MPGLARPTSRAAQYLRVIGETGKVWGSEFTAKVVGQYTQLALDWFSNDC